jgi:hypothetical protein
MNKPTRFYEFQKIESQYEEINNELVLVKNPIRRHYRTLKNLCEGEGLNYDNVYHQVGRNKAIWKDDGGRTVQRLTFSD